MRAEGRGTTRSSRAAGGWLQSGSQCHLQALQGKSGSQCHLQALQGKKRKQISNPGDREGCGRGADL